MVSKGEINIRGMGLHAPVFHFWYTKSYFFQQGWHSFFFSWLLGFDPKNVGKNDIR